MNDDDISSVKTDSKEKLLGSECLIKELSAVIDKYIHRTEDSCDKKELRKFKMHICKYAKTLQLNSLNTWVSKDPLLEELEVQCSNGPKAIAKLFFMLFVSSEAHYSSLEQLTYEADTIIEYLNKYYPNIHARLFPDRQTPDLDSTKD